MTGRNVWPRGASAEDVAGLHVLPGGAPLAEVPVFKLIESLERVLVARQGEVHPRRRHRPHLDHRQDQRAGRSARSARASFTFESCFAFVEEPAQTRAGGQGAGGGDVPGDPRDDAPQDGAAHAGGGARARSTSPRRGADLQGASRGAARTAEEYKECSEDEADRRRGGDRRRQPRKTSRPSEQGRARRTPTPRRPSRSPTRGCAATPSACDAASDRRPRPSCRDEPRCRAQPSEDVRTSDAATGGRCPRLRRRRRRRA